MRLKTILLFALLPACAGMAMARQSGGDDGDAYIPQQCESLPYHGFDFWLGEWTVTDPAGRFAGTSSIRAEEDGCLIVERWTGAEGSTGQSYNYYDPGRGMWRQHWVSPSVVIDYEGGLNQRGDMILEGDISYRNGDTFDFRGTWRLRDDGAVVQHFEQYNPDENVWEDWFIGIYRKQ